MITSTNQIRKSPIATTCESTRRAGAPAKVHIPAASDLCGAYRCGKVQNPEAALRAVRAPVLGRTTSTPIAALAAEHRSHELLEFFVLRDVGTLESSFTTSSAPPPNEQCASKQTHQSLNSTIDGCAGDCGNGVHVQIGDATKSQARPDIATSQDEGDRRVRALAPFRHE